MCGICGIFDRQGGPVEEETVLTMREVMTSRGPDDAGVHHEAGLGLGHRRLSILDLSSAGHQPMANEDETVWVVHNGEIYNFPELRKELVSAGHRFRSQTDTEVLVHGYEEWGDAELLERIRGMFAFGLWDRKERKLLLARDRVGKKPLFYYDDGRRVYFSSDIKSIWLVNGDSLTVDPRALDEFLFHGYVLNDRSIYDQVSKLPPAHSVAFTPNGSPTEPQRYWKLRFGVKHERREEDWLDGIEEHATRAVQRRLVSDVPLGAFLSGGVDSSYVCALMARSSGTTVRTFTVGFEMAPDYDERHHAAKVARHISSDHTEIVLNPDVWSILPRLVWSYGEPYADSSAVPSWFVAEAARKHVTVVLTGDGGDECFAGYGAHVATARSLRFGYIPGAIRSVLIPRAVRAARKLLPQNAWLMRADIFASHLAGDVESGTRFSAYWADLHRDRLHHEAFRSRLNGWHPAEVCNRTFRQSDGPTVLDRQMDRVIAHQLSEDYLVKIDVATMAHSLEARSPFLDTDLMEFAATIPASMMLPGREGKPLLKKAAARAVPPEVIYRPKQGFEIPVGEWFRTDWYDRLRRLLLSPEARGREICDSGCVERTLEEHRAWKADHKYRIWTLLVLEIWHRLFVDRTLSPTDALPAD